MKSAGVFIRKTSCPACGSIDNLGIYSHEDGTHSASCFGIDCGAYYLNWDNENGSPQERSLSNKEQREVYKMSLPSMEVINEDYISYDNRDRKLRAEDYDFYGVKMELGSDGETIDKIFYPTYRGEKQTGFRCRSRFEEGHPQLEKKPELLGVLKNFQGSIGDCKVGINLFGQHLYDPAKSKRLILTCGEEDAVATRKMLKKKAKNIDNYAIVSAPSGENVKWIKPHLEWVSKFEEIYIITDADEAGDKFKEALVKILPVGKLHIVKLEKGCKDPCDVLKKYSFDSAATKMYRAIFDSEKYSPVGVKSIKDGWGSYLNRGKDTLIPFPQSFGDLNDKTCGGGALGEIVTIAAPSSVGKSSFVKEWINTVWEETPYSTGVVSLEETLDEFIEGMLSVRMSTQLNEIPYDQRDRDLEFEAFKELTGMGTDEGCRIHFVDHQGGANSWEEMKAKIEFLIKGLDCKVIVFDPATLAVSTMNDVDEDEVLSDILKLVKANNILWVNVLHVRKNSSGTTANSEGADITEEDIKGTGTWFQVSMINLLLSRNKVHDNPVIRNTTKIKMSKCRRHGKNTGIAGYTYYNGDTGRLMYGQSPEEIMKDIEEFGEASEEKEW